MTFTALVVHRATYAATVLGIPDLLGADSRTSDELAEAIDTDADATYRLLRALASAGLLVESEGRRFSLTEVGSCLRDDVDGSMRGWVLFSGSPMYGAAWQEIVTSIQTAEPGWTRVHGVPFFDYLRDRPDAAAIFDDAMTSLSSWEARAVVEACDLSQARTLVDIGGGQGTLLAALLNANPGLNGVLFDQPETVTAASSYLAQQGVADRCDVVGGDFFESVPSGGDAYLLKYIVHDWDDENAIRILVNCRDPMAEAGRILLAETVVPEAGQPDYAKLADLEMLVLLGSRERAREEYEVLLGRAGLALKRIIPTREHIKIIEAVRPSEL